MNTKTTTGTTIRSTPTGLVLTHGARELHILGTSADQIARARRLAATHSFARLFKVGRQTRTTGRNVAFIKLAA